MLHWKKYAVLDRSQVFQAKSLSQNASLDVIGCSDDAPTDKSRCQLGYSRVEFIPEPTAVHYIAVSGFNKMTGDVLIRGAFAFDLPATPPPPPAPPSPPPCPPSPPPPPPLGTACESAHPFGPSSGDNSFILSFSDPRAHPQTPSLELLDAITDGQDQCFGTYFLGSVDPVYWVKLTDPREGWQLRLHTCHSGSFDTDLSVLTGSCSSLTVRREGGQGHES